MSNKYGKRFRQCRLQLLAPHLGEGATGGKIEWRTEKGTRACPLCRQRDEDGLTRDIAFRTLLRQRMPNLSYVTHDEAHRARQFQHTLSLSDIEVHAPRMSASRTYNSDEPGG